MFDPIFYWSLLRRMPALFGKQKRHSRSHLFSASLREESGLYTFFLIFGYFFNVLYFLQLSSLVLARGGAVASSSSLEFGKTLRMSRGTRVKYV